MTFSINTEKPYLLGLDLMTESPLPILKSISAVLKENFWVLLACVVVSIICFFFYLLSKRKKAEEIVENKVIEIDPFEEAFEKMKLLAESSPRLAAKPFIFKLSEIIRLFIERQFKIPALEQTGEEFLRGIANHSFLQQKFEKLLSEFVFKGDRIKYSPDSFVSEDLDDLLATAQGFVEQVQHELNLLKVQEKEDQILTQKTGS
jgi:hypothetical protein